MKVVRLGFFFGLFFASTHLWATTLISLEPVTEVVSPGQLFSLSADITGASDLYAFQFDVAFNPAILSAISVSEGAFLPTGGTTLFLPGTIDDVGGTVSYNADTLETAVAGVSGSGILLTLSFKALAPGSSTVQIINLLALNSFGEGLTVSTASSLAAVNSSAAPEPATFWLAGGCVVWFGLVWLRRCGGTQIDRLSN